MVWSKPGLRWRHSVHGRLIATEDVRTVDINTLFTSSRVILAPSFSGVPTCNVRWASGLPRCS